MNADQILEARDAAEEFIKAVEFFEDEIAEIGRETFRRKSTRALILSSRVLSHKLTVMRRSREREYTKEAGQKDEGLVRRYTDGAHAWFGTGDYRAPGSDLASAGHENRGDDPAAARE